MSIQKSKRTSSRTRSVPRDCCDDKCPAGSRNNYFLGKHLTPDSYRLEQSYGLERRRLLNRAIHGWGVVYGFALATGGGQGSRLDPGELRIGEGLALDRLGRELIQVRGLTLELDNLLILDEDGKPVRVDGCELDDRLDGLTNNVEDCWLLTAHYAETTIGPVTLKDPCCDDRKEWDQTCETIVYALRRIDCDECCQPWICELHCECAPDSPCCGERDGDRDEIARERQRLREEYEKRLEAMQGQDPAEIAKLQTEYERMLKALDERWLEAGDDRIHPRGGCACLCEHLTGLEIGDDCARLSDIGDCTRADLGNGVALACLRLARTECDDWRIGSVVDACGPRRLVKRNDLLFDLINGCDVTRIVETGWGSWHRREQPVPFDAFAEALGWDDQDEYGDYPARDFWVRFSRPVRENTLTTDAFAMAVMSDQPEGGWLDYFRVPIVAVKPGPREPDDPPDHVRGAQIVVSGAWLRDGVMGEHSIFLDGETRVEIEVRGDFIEDCLGQTVDANPRGRSPFPTGTDGPGDSYLSAFTVARRPESPKKSRPSVKGRRSTAAA